MKVQYPQERVSKSQANGCDLVIPSDTLFFLPVETQSRTVKRGNSLQSHKHIRCLELFPSATDAPEQRLFNLFILVYNIHLSLDGK